MSENETVPSVPLIRFIGDVAPLFEALSTAQGQFGVAQKTATNPHFRSKYAPLDEIIAATKEALSSNGLALVQVLAGGGGDYELLTALAHSSGARLESTIRFRGEDIHKLGSGTTYLKRYTRAAMLGIATEDDDGNETQQPEAAPAQRRSQPTPPAPKPQQAKAAPPKPAPVDETPKAPPVDPQVQADIDRRKAQAVGDVRNVTAAPEAAIGVLIGEPPVETTGETVEPPTQPSWETLADGHVPDDVSMRKGSATGAFMKELFVMRGFGFETAQDVARTLGFIAEHTGGGNPQVKDLTYGQARSVIRALEAMS